jgi:hypothetical protein
MKKETTLGIIRHALTFVGGVLITAGYLDAEVMLELSGAIMTVVGGVWSIIDKADSE